MKKWWLVVFIFFSLITKGQIITTFAGNGISGNTGDGGPATSAKLLNPAVGKFDRFGNYYFSQQSGCSIRKIDTAGIITTIAGNGINGFAGDSSLAISAELNYPEGIAFDTSGNLYIADHDNWRIRKIDILTGIITTFAGNGMHLDYADSISAYTASFFPADICFDKNNNLYIADNNYHKIRKINSSGIIFTYAGTGIAGFSGDEGPATLAKLETPTGVIVDKAGNVYVADAHNARVRKIDTSGIINTIAGNGASVYSGDGIPATSASIAPLYLSIDNYDNIYISDSNERILKVDSDKYLYSIVGNGVSGYAGDGGLADTAEIYGPGGLTINGCGNIYFPDVVNNRIRKVSFDITCTITIDTSNRTSLNTVSAQNFTIYPNPATVQLHIDNLQTQSNYSISNIIGTVIQQGTLQSGNNSINIERLPPGVYILKVSGAQGTESMIKKIVKE